MGVMGHLAGYNAATARGMMGGPQGYTKSAFSSWD
jgi:hypothetical protein